MQPFLIHKNNICFNFKYIMKYNVSILKDFTKFSKTDNHSIN